jgi:AcrR family transcriptional regulator
MIVDLIIIDLIADRAVPSARLSSMVGRPRSASDEQILDAAERAIARYGPAQLTLAHITAEVGLAPATLVQRFGSKRGLLLAVKARAPQAIRAAFTAIPSDAGSPMDRLHLALAALVRAIDSPVTLANTLAFMQLDLVDPEFTAIAVEQSRELRTQLRVLLVEGTVAGELVRHDHTRLAQAIYTNWSGSLMTWAVDGDGALTSWLHRDIETLLAPYRSLVG